MKLKEFIQNVIWTIGIFLAISLILGLGAMSLVICLIPDASMDIVWVCGEVTFVLVFAYLSVKSLQVLGMSLKMPQFPSIKDEIARRKRYKAVMQRYNRYFYLKSLKTSGNKYPAKDFDVPLYVFKK